MTRTELIAKLRYNPRIYDLEAAAMLEADAVALDKYSESELLMNSKLHEAAQLALDTLIFMSNIYTDRTDPTLENPIAALKKVLK